jgi:cytochrome P450
MSLEEYETLDRASREFMDYLRLLIERRRRAPQDDLITALIQAHDEEEQLTEDELVSVCILIFGAGEETMVNLLGNGTLALMSNRDKLNDLRRRPEITPSAVEELLRYDAPLQMTSRTALEDIELGGKHIRKGDQLYIAIGSANRDPEAYVNPDELELEREKNHHMAFADGHHLCVGAPLARVEGQEAFRVLLEMIPDIELAVNASDLRWRDHIVLRGLTRLPVKFRARG